MACIQYDARRNYVIRIPPPISTLILVAMQEETYTVELARALNADYQSMNDLVRRLEEDEILVGLTVGRQRRVRLNFRYTESKAIKELLIALVDADEEARRAAASVRRRSRRREKPL